jgi:CRISPR-associated exonuclease Cas4
LVDITGTLIWYYYICPREAWLMAHEINPEQDNPYIDIGRLIHEESYLREDKGFETTGMKIDIIKQGDEGLIICEVKKSDKYLKSATMQLSFYLCQLKQKGVKATGELLIPKSKKKTTVELTSVIEIELTKTIAEINNLVETSKPPGVKKIHFCGKCGYKDFCYA